MAAVRNLSTHFDPTLFAGISGVVNNWNKQMAEIREKMSPLTVALLSGGSFPADPFLAHLKATNPELSFTQPKEELSGNIPLSTDETKKDSVETKPAA